MRLDGNTILITGGASGIGYALAQRLLAAGSTVVVCGRRADRLAAVRAAHPAIVTRTCDLARDEERIALARWATAEFPRLNVLVNNAGIQRRTELRHDDWEGTRAELAINLEAVLRLSTLLLPHLLAQPRAAILNVTSGLAHVPLASVPIYCATKAAVRSFTQSLRHQLRQTSVEVVEIAPPAVDTDLGGPGLHTFGVPVDELADAVLAGLARGELEITYGFSAEAANASRAERDEIFRRLNAGRPPAAPAGPDPREGS